MENSNQPEYTPRPRSNKLYLGVIFFLAGLALLAYKMGAPLPDWLFSWPMILIIIGLGLGLRDGFQNPGGWILLLIGTIFLADRASIGFDAHRYIGPIILIGVGILIIFRPSHRNSHRLRRSGTSYQQGNVMLKQPAGGESATNESSAHDEEYIQVNSVFGGVKKFIVSKNFKGGNIVAFMGGAEINLLQADIQHPIILEINNVFGGTKLTVPSNWDVKNEVTAIFGGIDDKRNPSTLSPESGKTVLIKGACIFGGIEISSY